MCSLGSWFHVNATSLKPSAHALKNQQHQLLHQKYCYRSRGLPLKPIKNNSRIANFASCFHLLMWLVSIKSINSLLAEHAHLHMVFWNPLQRFYFFWNTWGKFQTQIFWRGEGLRAGTGILIGMNGLLVDLPLYTHVKGNKAHSPGLKNALNQNLIQLNGLCLKFVIREVPQKEFTLCQ